MAATLVPYPPHQPQSAKRISPSAALANISAYLSQSETIPHLHPDAQLHPEAIKFSTTGGPSGGLVLHNVRRVEKGLNGEILAPEKDELDGMFGDDTNLDSLAAETEVGLNGEPKRKGGLKKKSAYDTETISAEEWALSQTVLEGEVGERDNADGDVIYGDEDGDAMDIDGGAGGAGMSKRDKENRKEEKKRRQKEEKRRKEEAKKAASQG